MIIKILAVLYFIFGMYLNREELGDERLSRVFMGLGMSLIYGPFFVVMGLEYLRKRGL